MKFPLPRAVRGRGTTRRVVEGVRGAGAGREAKAPSTASLRKAVPLPRFAGQDDERSAERFTAHSRESGNPAWVPAFAGTSERKGARRAALIARQCQQRIVNQALG
jgi:hypothetical protein